MNKIFNNSVINETLEISFTSNFKHIYLSFKFYSMHHKLKKTKKKTNSLGKKKIIKKKKNI